MNGKKSKYLRKFAVRVSGSFDMKADYVDKFIRGDEFNKFLFSRVLNPECSSAAYKRIKKLTKQPACITKPYAAQ